MKYRRIRVMGIILLIIVAIILIAAMVFAIVDKGNHKIYLLALGNKSQMIFQEEYDSENIDNISAVASSSNVEVRESNTDKIKVTAYGDREEKLGLNLENNTLTIQKERNTIYIFSFFAWYEDKLIIEIPKDYVGQLQVETKSGNAKVSSFEQVNAKIETSSGKINCQDVKNANLKSSSGNITLENGNEVTLKTTSGNIVANHIQNADIQTSSGNVKISELKQGTIKTTSGKIEVGNVEKIQLQTNSGNIKIDEVSESCQLSATSGSIKIQKCQLYQNSYISAKSGNVYIGDINDVYIDTKTSSGSVEIQKNDRKAEVELHIETTSGNIKVKNNENL